MLRASSFITPERGVVNNEYDIANIQPKVEMFGVKLLPTLVMDHCTGRNHDFEEESDSGIEMMRLSFANMEFFSV